MNANKRFLSGMRPVAELNLKHILVMNEWKKLQNDYQCFLSIDDLMALTTDRSGAIPANTFKMFKEWLICGIDPEQCVIFNQSLIPEASQLLQILMELLPAKMFMRNPVYKKKLANNEHPSLGILAAPLHELVDVLLYKTQYISTSMHSTVEFIRSAMRKLEKLNMFEYGKLELPQMLVSPIPDVIGIDGKRVDPQKKNYFSPNDSLEELRRKAALMLTPVSRKSRQDKCLLIDYFILLKKPYGAAKCPACAEYLADSLWEFFAEYRTSKEKFKMSDGEVMAQFISNIIKARNIAEFSLDSYKSALNLVIDVTNSDITTVLVNLKI